MWTKQYLRSNGTSITTVSLRFYWFIIHQECGLKNFNFSQYNSAPIDYCDPTTINIYKDSVPF